MITSKEFLEIVEKHVILAPNGNIVITDPKLAKQYSEFMSHYAIKPAANANDTNVGCVNGLCKTSAR